MQALEEKLQYHFKNPALLKEALRHSSYANEHRGAHFFSNERLEFLGDSVLGFVTAEFLPSTRTRRRENSRASARCSCARPACTRSRSVWSWEST